MMEGQPLKQEMSTDKTTGAQKAVSLDRYDLIPPKALEYLALVYGKGSRKYADRNWEKGYSWGKSFRALISHAYKAWRGEWYDNHVAGCVPGCLDHTELPHLSQVAWHCFALLTYYDNNLGTDDRSSVGRPITASEIRQRAAEVKREPQPQSKAMLDWAEQWRKDIDEQRRLKDWSMLPGPIMLQKKVEPKPFEFTREGSAKVEKAMLAEAPTLEADRARNLGYCPNCVERVRAGEKPSETQCGWKYGK